MSSVELQFEFEWLKRAINCSKWAISLQVGMRSLKTAGRERGTEGVGIQHRRFLENPRATHFIGGREVSTFHNIVIIVHGVPKK